MESACLALSRIAAALAHNPEQVGPGVPERLASFDQGPHAHSGQSTHPATALQRRTAHHLWGHAQLQSAVSSPPQAAC